MRGRFVCVAIDSRPPHYRIVVILGDLEGLFDREVVDLLGIPIGTIKFHINFGRRLLTEKLRSLIRGKALRILRDTLRSPHA